MTKKEKLYNEHVMQDEKDSFSSHEMSLTGGIDIKNSILNFQR